MLLGIVTDIHESVDLLELGLREFRRRGVDQVINLGDACDLYGPESQLGRVVDQLRDAQAIGVWGNHDFGLCYDISDAVKAKADATVLDYMSGMRPFLTLEDCRFNHVEPWLNPHLPEEIWYFDGPPDSPEKAARSFLTVPEKRLFLGHFHRWLVVTLKRNSRGTANKI